MYKIYDTDVFTSKQVYIAEYHGKAFPWPRSNATVMTILLGIETIAFPKHSNKSVASKHPLSSFSPKHPRHQSISFFESNSK
jgi:hypothetical protein